MQGKWKLGGRILSSASMSIMHLSSGKVNIITQMRLQFLDWSFSPLRIATEIIEVLRYNLSAFWSTSRWSSRGILWVVNNSSITTPVLNKRHNDIFYHMVQEVQDSGVLHVGRISGEFNLEDFFTKTKILGSTSHDLVESILSNIVSPIADIDKA